MGRRTFDLNLTDYLMSTVNIDINSCFGQVPRVGLPIKVRTVSDKPVLDGNVVYCREELNDLVPTNGILSYVLEQGDYEVVFNAQQTIRFTVPNDSNTYWLPDLVDSEALYVPPALPVSGVNFAYSSSNGLLCLPSPTAGQFYYVTIVINPFTGNAQPQLNGPISITPSTYPFVLSLGTNYAVSNGTLYMPGPGGYYWNTLVFNPQTNTTAMQLNGPIASIVAPSPKWIPTKGTNFRLKNGILYIPDVVPFTYRYQSVVLQNGNPQPQLSAPIIL